MSAVDGKPGTLDDISILEYLEQDPRPTFVLELKQTLDFGSGLFHPVVCNTALLNSDSVFGAVVGTRSSPAENQPKSNADFKTWVTNTNAAIHSSEKSRTTFDYYGFFWTRIILQKWIIVSGFSQNIADPSSTNGDPIVPMVKRLKVDAISHGEDSVSRRSEEWAFDPRDITPHRAMPDKNVMTNNFRDNDFEPVAPDEVPFKRLAEVNPAGIFFISLIGEVLWANEAWYTITDHPRTSSQMSFMDTLVEEDLLAAQAKWHKLLVAKETVDFDARLRKKWYHEPSKTWRPVWIHADAAPELNSDGSLKSVMGCIRDITAAKQAQEDQIEYEKVSAQLALKTQQYRDSEKKFALMAHTAPYGMFLADPQGAAVWVNSKYCEMTQQSTDVKKHHPRSNHRVVAPEHHPLLDEQFEKLVTRKEQVSFEYRTIIPCIGHFGEGTIDRYWHHCIAFPEPGEEGSISGIMGILTDISHMKAAEALQTQKTIAAEEAKREQERFMDITSHELRNPLGAMLQSADGILGSLKEYQCLKTENNAYFDALVESNIDSLQVIMLCAQHQGRIINDVLTLSKLDSGLLLVSPIPAQPIKTMQQVLKMFDAEISAHEMDLEFQVEQSYHSLEVDWVLVDPSRLTQVFINLMTNAIKFTKSESHRKITVSVGASSVRPRNEDIDQIEWFPTRSHSPQRLNILDCDWTEEGQIFLTFAVQDTGRGISHEEKSRLFHRFSQADPRTHVEYGGSGLGLFISRELAERHGGEIGIKSIFGKGSTFAFYVKAHKVDEPTPERRREGSSKSPTARPKASYQNCGPQDGPRPQPGFSPATITSHVLTPTSRPTNQTLKVLLVEDNLVNQRVLSKQLLKAGCTVHLANHGQEALDHLRTSTLWSANQGNGKTLNIILMDLEMPVMNGMTAVRRIREMQACRELMRHVPIIAVTANARLEQVEASLKGGMDDVMAKPFLMNELLPKMERLVARWRREQE